MNLSTQYLLLMTGEVLGVFFVLRFMLPLFGVPYQLPLSQIADKTTRWLCGLFGFVPSPFAGRLDIPAAIAMLLWYIGLTLLYFWPLPAGVAWHLYLSSGAMAAVLVFVNLVFVCVIISVILSWVAPFTRNLYALVPIQISQTFCQPIRNILPALGGLDFSPIFALLTLTIVRNMLTGAMAYEPLAWLLRLL